MSFGSMYRSCYRSAGVRGQQGAVGKNGTIEAYSYGRGMHVHSTEPPSAAIYQQWLDGQLTVGPRGQHAKIKITGEKLRRAVRMVRNGYSVPEISRAVSCDVRKWLQRLPPELKP
jgi:hypothetical protein